MPNSSSYNMSITKKQIYKPLLKWVGGKGQIIDKLFHKFPREIHNYHEMFVGGGSVLTMLLWAIEKKHISVTGQIYAYDLNEALIGAYRNIQKNPRELYENLITLKKRLDKCPENGELNRKASSQEEALSSKESYYYWIRKQYNTFSDKTTVESSAYFIFLNKTCFRGMFREGPNGYNVPYGHNKNPSIIDKDELNRFSKLIRGVRFECCDFSVAFKDIKDNTENFIYLDPPYAPENESSFVGYTKDGFDLLQHETLFEMTISASNKNKVMMSNADVPLIRKHLLEPTFKYEVVSCRRAINSKNPAAKTNEVILTNYSEEQ